MNTLQLTDRELAIVQMALIDFKRETQSAIARSKDPDKHKERNERILSAIDSALAQPHCQA